MLKTRFCVGSESGILMAPVLAALLVYPLVRSSVNRSEKQLARRVAQALVAQEWTMVEQVREQQSVLKALAFVALSPEKKVPSLERERGMEMGSALAKGLVQSSG